MTFRDRLEALHDDGASAAEIIAVIRQEAWSNLGRWSEAHPQDAWLAAALTVALHGHSRDVTSSGPKVGYFTDYGGIGAEKRAASFLAVPDGVHPPADAPQWLDELMRRNGKVGRGRVRLWTEGRTRGKGATIHQSAGVSKAVSIGDESAEVLGSQSVEKSGHVTTDVAGGQHDLAWLVYQRLCRHNGFTLEQHRDAMRPGRLPAELRFAKADAERIVVALDAANINHTEIGRVFNVDRKTIGRTIKRSLNVPLFPYKGKEQIVTVTEFQGLRAELHTQGASLARIETLLQTIALQTVRATGSPVFAGDMMTRLLLSAAEYEGEAA